MPRIEIAPETLEKARGLYAAGATPADLARLMGISETTLRRRVRELGWSRRAPVVPGAEDHQWPEAPPPVREPQDEDLHPQAMIERLTRMAAREMLRAETYDHSPEGAARTLVMLSRTLGNLLTLWQRVDAIGGAKAGELVDYAAEEMAPFEAVADVVARFRDLYDEEGPEQLLDRARRFIRPLVPLAEMVVRDRRREADDS